MHEALIQRPDRSVGLARLAAFLPRAGRAYAALRNHDRGPGVHEDVSCLSPYLRHRLITEEEVIRAVVDAHGALEAEKFIQEVFWRTYWKGWLERRPNIWRSYCAERDEMRDRINSDASLFDKLQHAEAGETGIACFDAWMHELHHTGYLHNHARMWAASIWIFTLNLPWSLGADLFLRRLLDGDPASNTLSWRWVAGLQTRGKTYLARSDNIATYTNGRFAHTPDLARDANALDEPPPPPALDPPKRDRIESGPPTALIVLDDDVAVDDLVERLRPVGITGVSLASERSCASVMPHVVRFADGAVDGGLACLRSKGHTVAERRPYHDRMAADLAAWSGRLGVSRVALRYAPVGPGRDFVEGLRGRLEAIGISLAEDLRPYDARAWRFADRGFFSFKKHIPALIDELA